MSRPVFWWALASAGLMVVGGFAPWASVFGAFTVSGTDGDGWFLVIGGIIAGALLIIRFVTASRAIWFVIVSLVLALLCALVSAVDLADVTNVAEGEGLEAAVEAEWGLYLSLLASLSLAAASIALLVTGRGSQQIAPGPAAYTPPGTAHLPPAPAGAAPAGAATPAGWYPDPKGEKRLRYWDGAAWTDHTAD